jgi:CheY-like chemotaxis protein
MLPNRILIATAPSGLQRLQKVLAGCELVPLHTLEEARSILDSGRYECIVLGIQFDESRMLKLLQHLRADPRHRNIAAVCVIGAHGRLSDVALEAFRKAARALDAAAVLDINDYPDDSAGNARLRESIEQALLVPALPRHPRQPDARGFIQ